MGKNSKRRRGGQPGNQNARKHGFYSVNLTPREICELWNTVNLERVDPQVLVLRMKTSSALRAVPGNHRVLREASRMLVKWYGSRYRLDNKDRVEIKKWVSRLLELAAGGEEDNDGTNRS